MGKVMYRSQGSNSSCNPGDKLAYAAVALAQRVSPPTAGIILPCNKVKLGGSAIKVISECQSSIFEGSLACFLKSVPRRSARWWHTLDDQHLAETLGKSCEDLRRYILVAEEQYFVFNKRLRTRA